MRTSLEGQRHYEITGEKLPSVTTILSATQSDDKKESIARWTARVGKEQATRVKDQAASRGTNMHLHHERYIEGKGHLDLTDEGQVAGDMAQTIIDKGLCDMSEIWGSEVALYVPNLYAGTTDLVGQYKGNACIMDFKQTNKPKKLEWVQDYFLQLTAYAIAHNEIYDTNINEGHIFMCSRAGEYQQFDLWPHEFKEWEQEWWNRVYAYYEKHG